MTTRLAAFQPRRVGNAPPIDVPPPRDAHAGLWLDKHIGDQRSEMKETRHNLVRQVADLGEPTLYAAFYARWRVTLDAWAAARPGEALVLGHGRVCGRMAVGLGGESVLETAIRLHQTYGVPYIPGSALKGLARSYALHHLDEARWGAASPAFQVVFGVAPEPGDQDEENGVTASFGAGYVTFFDALYVPQSGVVGHPLHRDVLTVHHPDYYAGKPNAPADWDNPNPVPFLTATGAYLIALGGPGDWALAAYQILEKACAELGVGAKTSSGYGRLTLSRDLKAPVQQFAARGSAVPLSSQAVQPQSAQPAQAQPQPPVAPPVTPPQTVFPNATPLPPEATATVPPVTGASDWRRATVLRYSPWEEKGRLQDVATKDEFEFAKAARVGGEWMPKKDLPVEYQRDPKQPGRAAAVRQAT